MGKTIVKHSFFKGIPGGSSYLYVNSIFLGNIFKLRRSRYTSGEVTCHPGRYGSNEGAVATKAGGVAFQHRLRVRGRKAQVQLRWKQLPCALLVQICDQCWICDRYVGCT